MRAVVGDFLRARAQAGHRHQHLGGVGVFAVFDRADEGDFVIEQALHAGNRRGLVDEIGEAHLDVARFGFQAFDHLAQHAFEVLDRNLALARVENFDEARHVGALEVMRQVHVHVEVGDGVLDAAALVRDPNRVADAFDADLVDGDLPGVGRALYVRHAGGVADVVHDHSLDMSSAWPDPIADPAQFRLSLHCDNS